MALQPTGGFDQNRVAGWVAIAIVDLLEVIEICQHQGEFIAAFGGTACGAVQKRFGIAAVEKPGHRIFDSGAQPVADAVTQQVVAVLVLKLRAKTQRQFLDVEPVLQHIMGAAVQRFGGDMRIGRIGHCDDHRLTGGGTGSQIGQKPQADARRHFVQLDNENIGDGVAHQRLDVTDLMGADVMRHLVGQTVLPVPRGLDILGHQRHRCLDVVGGATAVGQGQDKAMRGIALEVQFFIGAAGAQQAADPGLQDHIVQRLRQHVVDPCRKRLKPPHGVIRAADGDHRHIRQAVVAGQFPFHICGAAIGQGVGGQNQIGAAATGNFQHTGDLCRQHDIIIGGSKLYLHHDAVG